MAGAPNGQYHAHIGAGISGAEANELAISAAKAWYAKEHGVDASSLEVLGFNNSNHGSSQVTLPAPFPQLKYPFAQYEHENDAEEARCLESFKQIIKSSKDSGK